MVDKVVQQEMIVKKRDGRLISFERELISRAIQKAFRADLGLGASQPLSIELVTEIEEITSQVVKYDNGSRVRKEKFTTDPKFKPSSILVNKTRLISNGENCL